MARKNSATSIVRAPLPVRARMQVLERVAPQRAAVVAERLWFTVPRPPAPPRMQRYTPEGGEPFFLMSGHSEVSGQCFGPQDGPVALLVHGWGGYWQQLSSHVPGLVAAGYRVVAYDAPSHGRSTHGAEGLGSGSVPEMADAVNSVLDLAGEPTLVVAHSLGAMAVMRALRGHRPARGYVFLAPEVKLEPAVEWFEQVVGMGPRTRRLFVERLQRRIGTGFDDFDVTGDVRRLAAEPDCPRLLAVHDTDDPDTPIDETRSLVRLWPGAELLETSGLGHRQVIWHDEVVRRVAGFGAELVAQPPVRPVDPA